MTNLVATALVIRLLSSLFPSSAIAEETKEPAEFVKQVFETFPNQLSKKAIVQKWERHFKKVCIKSEEKQGTQCNVITPATGVQHVGLFLHDSGTQTSLRVDLEPGAITAGKIESVIQSLPGYEPNAIRKLSQHGSNSIEVSLPYGVYRALWSKEFGLTSIVRVVGENNVTEAKEVSAPAPYLRECEQPNLLKQHADTFSDYRRLPERAVWKGYGTIRVDCFTGEMTLVLEFHPDKVMRLGDKLAWYKKTDELLTALRPHTSRPELWEAIASFIRQELAKGGTGLKGWTLDLQDGSHIDTVEPSPSTQEHDSPVRNKSGASNNFRLGKFSIVPMKPNKDTYRIRLVWKPTSPIPP